MIENFLKKHLNILKKAKLQDYLLQPGNLKAFQFHIPSDIADFEKNLQRDISLFNARIAEETNNEYLILNINKQMEGESSGDYKETGFPDISF